VHTQLHFTGNVISAVKNEAATTLLHQCSYIATVTTNWTIIIWRWPTTQLITVVQFKECNATITSITNYQNWWPALQGIAVMVSCTT